MNKIFAILIIGIFAIGIIAISSATDQFAQAGSTKKVHFTQTIISLQDPAQGYGDYQFSMILSPNAGTLYDGSITFTSSEPVQLAVLHEIDSQEAKGQPTWSIDGNTIYGLSLLGSENTSGSFEFTGAAIGLRSFDSKEFVSTVSVDGWIRGQPTEIISQKLEIQKEEPSLLLANSSVPVTIPMHTGIYQGNDTLYILTDASDKKYAEDFTNNQKWNVEHAESLANPPDEALQQMYAFKNGIKGDGLFGYQPEVFSATPEQSTYSALSSLVEVTWKSGQSRIVFESAEAIIKAEDSGRVQFNNTGIILNTPQIVWPQGQMLVRTNSTITDVSYDGGQIIELDSANMTVTFVAHKGWGPDGSVAYRIITDATPAQIAETMGVAYSPTSKNLVISSAATDMFQFKNGIRGSGPLGFQPDIASAVLKDENYSPMWRVYLVEWNDTDLAKILQTKSEIDSFRIQDMISVGIARPLNSDHIINSPIIDPFQ